MEYLAVLLPSIGLGVLFWLIMRWILRADSRERRAQAAAEQASRQGTDGRLSHGLLVIADRQGQHPGRCPEAGEVPCPHRPLDVVVTQGLDVEQHDSVERPV